MVSRVTVETNPRLRDLRTALRLDQSDMQEILRLVDDRFVTNERRLFATEGSSGGSKWAPLDPKYKKAKQKKFPGRKVMSRSGALRKSLTNKGDTDHVATYQMTKPQAVMVGTKNKVAAYHIKGRHNKGQPKHTRDTLQHTEQQKRALTGEVRRFLIDTKLERVRRAMSAWRGSRFRRAR
jgi:phage gpG-like protein